MQNTCMNLRLCSDQNFWFHCWVLSCNSLNRRCNTLSCSKRLRIIGLKLESESGGPIMSTFSFSVTATIGTSGFAFRNISSDVLAADSFNSYMGKVHINYITYFDRSFPLHMLLNSHYVRLKMQHLWLIFFSGSLV